MTDWHWHWYLRLSVDDNNKAVWLVKVVKQLNNTSNMSYKLEEMNFQRYTLSI